MRFLPIFIDLTSGVVALIGAGGAASNKLQLLRAAHANVRWFPGSVDVAEEVTQFAAGAGRLEIAVDDPLTADWSDVIAVVCAAGNGLDEKIAARARAL